jgi:hypothetical protein
MLAVFSVLIVTHTSIQSTFFPISPNKFARISLSIDWLNQMLQRKEYTTEYTTFPHGASMSRHIVLC